jgi:sporulation protein YlmC with PRC-barrel domain
MAAAGAGARAAQRISNLIGKSVQSTQGEQLGTVQDVLIDENGRVTHVLMEADRSQSTGSGMSAIPWSALSANTGQGERIVVDRSSVQSTPKLR